MPKITAIISAYYCAEWLEDRIWNLVDQKVDDLEIVAVAQEGSAEHDILFGCKFGDQHVTLVTTNNVPTVYHAWNSAIEASTGEYVTNANSDDRLRPGGLKILAGMLDDHPEVAVAYFNISRVDKIGGNPIGEFHWKKGCLPELLEGCFLGPMPMWRRSLHKKYGLFDPSYHVSGDYEFWMRLAAGGEKFWHSKSILGDHLEKENCLEHREPVRTIWETAKARSLYR